MSTLAMPVIRNGVVVDVAELVSRGCRYLGFSDEAGWWCCEDHTVSVDTRAGVANVSVRTVTEVSARCADEFFDLRTTTTSPFVESSAFAALVVGVVLLWLFIVLPVLCVTFRCWCASRGCCVAREAGSSGAPLVQYVRMGSGSNYASSVAGDASTGVAPLSATVHLGAEGFDVTRTGPDRCSTFKPKVGTLVELSEGGDYAELAL